MEKILMSEPLHGILPDSTEISVPVRISSRCKRLILRAVGDRFELVVPPGCPTSAANSFFQDHLDWIARVIVKRQQYLQKHPKKPEVIPEELFLAFTGKRYTVIYQPAEVCWTGARLEENTLIVSGRVGTYKECTGALRQWLIRYAEQTLLPHALNIAENHGFSGLTKLRTGIQKNSWGTCNRKGIVTLNAALLFFTKPLTEYVILHEFCHLTELNHSARFWAKLESVYPGAKEARESLKQAALLLPDWIFS
jgi:predicted metal-dependent hydrolase